MIPGNNSLFRPVFKALYYIANIFIFIGESTQKIVLSLIKIPVNILLKLFRFISKVGTIAVKWQKTNLRIPKISLPRISLSFITTRVRYFILGVISTVIVISAWEGYAFVKALPSPYSIGKTNYPVSSHIYDRNGKLLYEIFQSQNRTPIKLKELPGYITQATVAIEDKDFYHHNGVALFSGILRALKEIVVNKNLQGGSTITQQLVKTALLTPDRTITRKIKEIILALWAERIYTKDQILEMYLNQVPYGGSAYGIQEAAKTYFGKDARDLTLDQAALLAGLPQAPSLYSPYNDPQAALVRRNEVLQAMTTQGYIDEATKEKLQNMPIDVLPPQTSIKAPHFVFYVRSKLEDMYGISTVEEGGLKVTTTLDLDIQETAEKILKEELAKVQYLNVTNGAILVTRPSTGEILAMVGSADYFNNPSGAFNVTTALRQPGSSIKPIMYTLSLEKGFTAASIIDDSPVIFNIPGSSPYVPVNYDGKFHGKVSLRLALANSYNIPAVKTLQKVGVSDFIDFAQKLGISTWTDKSKYGLSITLGGGDVTMVDMATAFGVLANNGYKVPLNYYLNITSEDSSSNKEYNPFKIYEVDPGITYIISDILSDNFSRQFEFGPNSALEIPGYKVAVKTGTTDDKKDNWTIGYTPDFLVAVWVGNNDNSPMNPYLASGITGAAPIWNRVMTYLLKNYSSGNQWYQTPANVISKTCYFGRTEYFIKGTENGVCNAASLGTSPTPTIKP